MDVTSDLAVLLGEIRACTRCEPELELGARPILQAGTGASVVIIGQAPGRKVHASGVPWDDPSGQRLRQWLGLTSDEFYDPTQVALIPMGFCFPGSTDAGDKPPRPECAPLWHPQLLDLLPERSMTIVIGAYAMKRYVPEAGGTLTETVSRWREFLPGRAVLPHPSPRNRRWLSTNPWFEEDVVPALRELVRSALHPA